MITVLTLDMKSMGSRDYSLRLGFPVWFGLIFALAHLVIWHLTQPAFMSTTFPSYSDILSYDQQVSGGICLCRELVYLLVIVILAVKNPVLLVFRPEMVLKGVGNPIFDVLSYAFEPEQMGA